MRFLTVREVALALFTFTLGIVTPAVIQAAERNPFQVVDGDGWLTSNADYNGNWLSLNANRPSFGLQLSQRNDLPFDSGTAGATFWVRNAGCTGLFGRFGEPCGWQLGLAVTQFRSIVVGGQGVEVDGLGALPPYARLVNSSAHGDHVAGLLTNAFVDFSGIDSIAAPSWFSGFDVDHDTFAVRRAPAGTQAFADLFTVDRAGDAIAAGSVSSSQAQQSAPGQWATRAKLIDGRYAFRYAKPFSRAPVCVATPEGETHVRVTPTASMCVVTADVPSDETIDIIVVGNPN